MDAVSQIKQKLDILDVVGSYVSLKKSGKSYKGLCPFHGEKTPSFIVSPEIQIYKCFGCGESGDMFSFVQKIEGVEFSDALEKLAEKAGVTLEKGNYDLDAQLKKQIYFINSLTAKFYNYLLTKHKAGAKGLDYFKNKRRLSDKTISDFMLGYAPDDWDMLYRFLKSKGFSDDDLLAAGVVIRSSRANKIIDKFKGRVMFPFTGIDEKIVGFSGRTIFDREPKYLHTSDTLVFNKSVFLYGLDKARVEIKSKGAVFVEGQMDVISAHQAGLNNVVASLGTSLTEGQLKVLGRYTQNITFCFDSDSAGVNAIYRGVELADKQNFNLNVALLPKEVKDIDELIVKNFTEAERLLREPMPVYDFFFVTALKKYDKKAAVGKKSIMADLAHRYSKINSPVVFEHYAKRLSEELGISMEIVFSMMRNPDKTRDKPLKSFENSEEAYNSVFDEKSKKSPEHYLLAILVKMDLEITKDFIREINKEDFTDPQIQVLYEYLNEIVDKEYITLEPKKATEDLDKINPEVKNLYLDLYMWDLGELSNDMSALTKELNNVISRVKNDSIKRQLTKLSESIKLAEIENDSKLLKSLTSEFSELSKKLAK